MDRLGVVAVGIEQKKCIYRDETAEKETGVVEYFWMQR